MRIGILGTGFGKRHAEIFKTMTGVEVVGIAGRDARKTADTARELGITAFGDLDELIARPNLDAIDVCLPSEVHARYVVAALRSGKHVFCETPVAFTLDDAERMRLAAEESGKLLLVALYQRFNSDYKAFHDLVATGRLGRPRFASAARRTPPIWGELAGTLVLNLMLHDIDYLGWLFGAPRVVSAVGVKNPKAGWDQVTLAFEYDTMGASVEGCCVMPLSFPFTTGLRVVGDEGALELNWRWAGTQPESELILYPRQGEPEKLVVPGYDPYEAECRYFADCVRGKADPSLLGIEAACASLAVAVAANLSLDRLGQRTSVE